MLCIVYYKETKGGEILLKTVPDTFSVRIRRGKLSEAAHIAQLALSLLHYHAQFDPYYTPADDAEGAYQSFFRQCMRDAGSLLLVAENAQCGDIAGYALAHIKSRPAIFALRDIGVLSDTFVKESYRQRGIGSAFMRRTVRWFKSRGIAVVELQVHSHNDIGRNVWQALGFRDMMIRQRMELL